MKFIIILNVLLLISLSFAYTCQELEAIIDNCYCEEDDGKVVTL